MAYNAEFLSTIEQLREIKPYSRILPSLVMIYVEYLWQIFVFLCKNAFPVIPNASSSCHLGAKLFWEPLRWWPRCDRRDGNTMHGWGCARKKHHVVRWGTLKTSASWRLFNTSDPSLCSQLYVVPWEKSSEQLACCGGFGGAPLWIKCSLIDKISRPLWMRGKDAFLVIFQR